MIGNDKGGWGDNALGRNELEYISRGPPLSPSCSWMAPFDSRVPDSWVWKCGNVEKRVVWNVPCLLLALYSHCTLTHKRRLEQMICREHARVLRCNIRYLILDYTRTYTIGIYYTIGNHIKRRHMACHGPRDHPSHKHNRHN